MPETNISNADVTDLTNEMVDYSVDTAMTDGISESKETKWNNADWNKQLGYYKSVPELTATIDAKATWTIGKGFKSEPITEMLLDMISGFGKDTFNTILENMVRTYHIGGDAFAEIITNDYGTITNIKPLDPSTVTVIFNNLGRIIRYEQNSKVKGKKPKKFEPEEIFHLSRNRVADEIHGVSVITAVENIILMRNEAMSDWKRVLHRNIDPLWIIQADTDNTTKIAKIRADYEKVRKSGESWIVPKGVVIPELIATAGNASLNPLAWIENLTGYFYQAVGVPGIVVGASHSLTESASKMEYLVYQQTIEEEQLFIEEQVMKQLSLIIELEFPADLMGDLLSDKKKDGEEETAAKPNEVNAEVEGKR